MEKPGGPEGRAAAFENPKSLIEAGLDQTLKGDPKVGADGPPAQEMRDAVPHVLRRKPNVSPRKVGGSSPGRRTKPGRLMDPEKRQGDQRHSFLQLTLQRFDLFGKCDILGHQSFDLAHGVQHRGVVASAEPPADFRQRAQSQRLGQIHRNLARADHVRGASARTTGRKRLTLYCRATTR